MEPLARRRGSAGSPGLPATSAAWLDDPNVRLPVTWDTADQFGRISAALRQKGRPIPTNDIWIAAQALESGADLISSDPHFGHIDGLPWVAFPAA